jgi:hypothetical protein
VAVKVPELYGPSPLTFTVDVKALVMQSFGPKAVKVIVPCATFPAVVGLMTGVPGSLAVPPSVAVSLIVAGTFVVFDGVPAIVAWVASVGVTGVTLKHSLVLVEPAAGSLDPVTPVAVSPE